MSTEEKVEEVTALVAEAKVEEVAAAKPEMTAEQKERRRLKNEEKKRKQEEKKAKQAAMAAKRQLEADDKVTFSADKSADFPTWYEQIMRFAEIVDKRYPVKGMPVFRPNGFYMHNKIMTILEDEWEKQDIQRAQFPLAIPRNFLEIEKDHVAGFEDEVFWITRGGKSPLDVELALRPTSETAMYYMFAMWARSFRDLPLKVHQTCNVFRYETKQTRPLIRAREIHWNEAHTCHATAAEAEQQLQDAYTSYLYIIEEICGFFGLRLRRPVWDQFPGGEYSIVMDTVMPCGKVLQTIGAHYLGQKFAEVFKIQFLNQKNVFEFAYMACFGVSTRILAACLSVHGDNRGLVVPHTIAQVQVIIVPIIMKKSDTSTVDKAREVEKTLKAAGIRCKVDDSGKRPGDKYYYWEMRGVPMRIEIGPRDLKEDQLTIVPRDTLTKVSVAGDLEKIVDVVREHQKEMLDRMRTKAESFHGDKVKTCTTLEECKETVLVGGFARVPVFSMDKDGEEADKIVHEATGGEIRGYVFGEEAPEEGSVCIATGKPATVWGYVARAY
eukprot:TRINITY_DN16936_c0_g1_i1.p1 TRINITY_DN16936_c0_g1~~TRINITY_DN16936_c0_g1_i1.p1  ORF type:complete len:571 (-),score=167.98 TRINITY_DN16936_c0_g1_i1:144-1802(-)